MIKCMFITFLVDSAFKFLRKKICKMPTCLDLMIIMLVKYLYSYVHLKHSYLVQSVWFRSVLR